MDLIQVLPEGSEQTTALSIRSVFLDCLLTNQIGRYPGIFSLMDLRKDIVIPNI